MLPCACTVMLCQSHCDVSVVGLVVLDVGCRQKPGMQSLAEVVAWVLSDTIGACIVVAVKT